MNKTLGSNIARLRKEKGMTQEELAEKLNISYQAVSKWENGVSCPDISNIKALAELFGVSIDELFGLSVAQKPEEMPFFDEQTEQMAETTFGSKTADEAANEAGLAWEDDGTIRIVAYRGTELLTVEEIRRIPLLGGKVSVNVSGEANNIFSFFDVNCETVFGSVQAGGDISCDSVAGDVNCGGDVRCDSVAGNVSAGGDADCDKVDGSVRAGGDVDCGDVGGDVNAGSDVNCGTVIGSVSAGGDIDCGRVGGSVTAQGDVSVK